jgi:ADP-ribosyl-[dinitrogen reductase] hydrolase
MKNVKDGIVGLVVGDALGVPYEFKPRKYFDENPVKSMDGYGTHNQPAGTWSDDSSLTLATLDSLTHGLDYEDIMKKFYAWFIDSDYTATGEIFDMGITTRRAIIDYGDGKSPILCGGTGERDNGNGSLMRILPIAYYLHENCIDINKQVEIINNISSLTHRHIRSRIACGIYVSIALKLINNEAGISLQETIKNGVNEAINYYNQKTEYANEIKENFQRIANEEIYTLPRDEIISSGYVTATLEACIWCLTNTTTYKDCVLTAVNLGHDTDTTAAVAGGLAGIYYGFDEIPVEWLNKIENIDDIIQLCNNFENLE